MFKKIMSIILTAAMLLTMPVLTACDSEAAQYEPLGMKFYKVSMISGPKTLEGYPSPNDAYVCKIGDTSETSITVPSEFKGKPVVAVVTENYNETLTDVTISEGVLYVDQAFYGYKALANVSLPGSLKAICNSFRQCDSLVSIEIPDGVTVWDGSFENCKNLETVTYKGTSVNVTDDSFKNCPKLGGEEADGLTDDEWAELLWNDAYGKLVEAGIVGEPLEFDGNGKPKIGRMSAFSGVSGKVIWADLGSFIEDELKPKVIHKSPNDKTEGITEYTCMSFNDVPFANERSECDYLMLYGGFKSRVDYGFYMGDVDRITTTTLVFVINVAKREIVHIECIGIDCPGITTDHTTGYTKVNEARTYMMDICS
ncbi:Leucine rich repeat-containing protein [Ruminococcaceae bacterium YRB3002]|nr:Leucine rich repeat-containing protein [Ruminococcaceae bacterium YRB3002]